MGNLLLMNKKNIFLFAIMLSFTITWSDNDQFYQVIAFRGRMDNFRTHKLMLSAEISPSRYFTHFDTWADRMNIQGACNLPIRRNIQTISSEIPSTYENLRRIIYNLELEGRDPEFYARFERKRNLFFEYLGYNPDIPKDFSTGLLTAYAYYQHVTGERVSGREFIEIFTFDYPDLLEQLFFLEFCEYMADIFQQLPENIQIQQMQFEMEKIPDTFSKKWNIPFSPLTLCSYSVSIQISGPQIDLHRSLETLIKEMTEESFILENEQLQFNGTVTLGIFYRPLF